MTCIAPDFAPSTAYRNYGCRCERCRAWKREAMRAYDARRTASPGRARRRRYDDGVVDWLIVDRLLSGEADITDATYGEALEAARRAYGRDGWWTWCDKALGLRSQRIKAIADEMAGAQVGA